MHCADHTLTSEAMSSNPVSCLRFSSLTKDQISGSSFFKLSFPVHAEGPVHVVRACQVILMTFRLYSITGTNWHQKQSFTGIVELQLFTQDHTV
jgi:hypothetical protein